MTLLFSYIPMNAQIEILQTWLIDRHHNPFLIVKSMDTLFSVCSAEVNFETKVDIGDNRSKTS